METAIVIIVLVVILAFGVLRAKGASLALKQAPSGSTKVVVAKANEVNRVQRRYTDAGWSVINSDVAKSFGRKATVTLTFRKN